MTKYYALLTSQGAAKLANAAALGTKLQITQMAVGDGGGTLPTPNASQTTLIAEKRRAAINALSVDAVNSSQIIAEQIIPESDGGFWIREIGLFDADGVMIAVANCPETYKPQLQEGSGRTQTVRMILIVNSTDAITLKIDPSVVLATRKYADDKAIEVKAYADNLLAQHIAAADPHKQYAPKASPVLSGKPTAPTAPAGDNTKQLATTEFVQAVAAALVSGAPAALDTLKKLADAIGGDADFAKTMLNKLAGKMDISTGVIAKMKYGCPLIGSLIYWPLELMPHEIWTDMDMEFIPYINQTFDGVKYPALAKLHPSLRLPADMRAEFARGWDNGRGGDVGRALMSTQSDAMRNFTGTLTIREAISNSSTAVTMTPAATGVLSAASLTSVVSYVPVSATGSAAYKADVVTFDPSTVVPTAAENRPRNVAWNIIVRAK